MNISLQVLSYLETATKHGLPVVGLWIQDWAGKIETSFGKRVFWNWEWNPEQYPGKQDEFKLMIPLPQRLYTFLWHFIVVLLGLDKEIKSLSAKGVKLLAYITPHMNVEGNLYKSYKDKDFFMKTVDGETYMINFGEFMCATVDLTNDEAREWYKGESIITMNIMVKC